MRCRNRQGEELQIFDNPTGIFRFLYDCAAGNVLLRALIRPGVSELVGRAMDSRASRLLIAPFMKRSGVSLEGCVEKEFGCFNEFFSRRLAAGERPMPEDDGCVTAPCDGKLTVYDIDENARFTIKGVEYTMTELLRDSAAAELFNGGVLMLFRLTVDDYHRYSHVTDGVETERRHLQGFYHTVNPYALERRAVFRENTREWSLVESERLGSVLTCEVGAMLVGKICNAPRTADGRVCRGSEKGYFRFGASSVIVCFQAGRITVDEDILRNTAEGYETAVRMGERVGRAV